MRKFAVSYINFDDKEIETKIVEYPTNNWYECLNKAFAIFDGFIDIPENIEDEEEAKEYTKDNFNFTFNVVEI